MDRRTIIQTINPAMERILGWSADELAGKPVTWIFADNSNDQRGRLIEQSELSSGTIAADHAQSELEIAGLAKNLDHVPLTVHRVLLKSAASDS